jgi:hypothetical protein
MNRQRRTPLSALLPLEADRHLLARLRVRTEAASAATSASARQLDLRFQVRAPTERAYRSGILQPELEKRSRCSAKMRAGNAIVIPTVSGLLI